jgi:iron transport multicopper oxidase
VTTISASGTIAHYLHALSTSTLADKMSLAIQSPAGITYSRQRSALTLFNGGVLIPFSSFCDNNRSTTRGYLVYANLSVSPASQTDFQTSYYDLSSIWMSGSGPAVVGNNIYFSTGNGGTPYPPANNSPYRNLPESLVKLTGSTAGPLSLSFSSAYTPSNYSYLDSNDLDFGSGGVLIVPSGAPTSIKASTLAQFVTAAGKVGILFVNNPALSNVQQVQIGDCWCGTTYFTGADGKGHVVTGGGTTLGSYIVSANGLSLTNTASLPSKTYGDAGVFTTVSSNGLTAGSGIVWAVSGPDSNYSLYLYAYNAANMSLLYSSQAGWWSNVGGNSNTVPVAANGHVYVASNGELTIWGPASGPLPAVPTGVGTDGSTDCPLMDVSWNPAAGATSYQLYFQPFGQAIVGSRRLKYTGSATSVAVFGGGNQLELVTVTACNQHGCSDPSVPAYGEVHKPCL